MKAIFLAAGEGTRLRPLTNDKPKCMVLFKGQPILEYGINSMRKAGINDISVIRGYLKNKINFPKIKYYENSKYVSTNMVSTFFCAEAEFTDNLIISYSDIIYNSFIVKTLADFPCDVGIIIDKEWYKLWSLRMENPLDDAETLKIDENGNILEIGKKTNTYNDINGQYIGLIKFSKDIVPGLQKFYHGLDKSILYDGKDFDNMFMTSFIQLLIDSGFSVKAIPIYGGWVEVDSIQDLKVYEKTYDEGKLSLAIE